MGRQSIAVGATFVPTSIVLKESTTRAPELLSEVDLIKLMDARELMQLHKFILKQFKNEILHEKFHHQIESD